MLKQPKFMALLLCFFFLSIAGCTPVEEQQNIKSNLNIDAKCITSQSQCEVENSQVKLSVKFYQQQLVDKVKTELPVYIVITDLSPHDVEAADNVTAKALPYEKVKLSAYLEGRDMFMGKVPVFFEHQKAVNEYMAETLLASCTEEEMVWRLWITAEVKGEVHTFFIDFTSQRL